MNGNVQNYPEHLNPFKQSKGSSLRSSFRKMFRSFTGKDKERPERDILKNRNTIQLPPPIQPPPNHILQEPEALPRSRFKERLEKTEHLKRISTKNHPYDSNAPNPFEDKDVPPLPQTAPPEEIQPEAPVPAVRSKHRKKKKKRTAPLPPGMTSSDGQYLDVPSRNGSKWSLTSTDTDASSICYSENEEVSYRDEDNSQLLEITRKIAEFTDDSNNNLTFTNEVTINVEDVDSKNKEQNPIEREDLNKKKEDLQKKKEDFKIKGNFDEVDTSHKREKEEIKNEEIKNEKIKNEEIKNEKIKNEEIKKEVDIQNIHQDIKEEVVLKDVINEDVIKQDVIKEDVIKENIKEDLIKENVTKENVIKEDVIKENVIKEDAIKENIKEDLIKENVIKEDVIKKNVIKEDAIKENIKEDVIKENVIKENVIKEDVIKENVIKQKNINITKEEIETKKETEKEDPKIQMEHKSTPIKTNGCAKRLENITSEERIDHNQNSLLRVKIIDNQEVILRHPEDYEDDDDDQERFSIKQKIQQFESYRSSSPTSKVRQTILTKEKLLGTE